MGPGAGSTQILSVELDATEAMVLPRVIALVDTHGRRLLIPMEGSQIMVRRSLPASAADQLLRIADDFIRGTVH